MKASCFEDDLTETESESPKAQKGNDMAHINVYNVGNGYAIEVFRSCGQVTYTVSDKKQLKRMIDGIKRSRQEYNARKQCVNLTLFERG